MLTKDDLRQLGKLTRTIVREEVESEVGNSREEFNSGLMNLKVDVATRIFKLEDRIKNNDIRLRREIRKLRKDLDGTINMADHGLIKLEKRVRTVEEHLNIPEPPLA